MFGILILTILECAMFASFKIYPFNELNRGFLKEKNKRLMKKYHLNPEDVVEEIYSLIQVRKNIKGENPSLKCKIKKLLI